MEDQTRTTIGIYLFGHFWIAAFLYLVASTFVTHPIVGRLLGFVFSTAYMWRQIHILRKHSWKI